MVIVFGVEVPVIELFLVFSLISIIILAEAIIILFLLIKQRMLGKGS